MDLDDKYVGGDPLFGTFGAGITSINGDGSPAQTISGSGGITVTSSGGTTTIGGSVGGITPVANGGTGQSTLFTAPTASTIPAWDANANLSADNLITGITITPTAGATTALDVSSKFTQYFTGTLSQTVTLPQGSTLGLGQSFSIKNLSTGIITVNTFTTALTLVQSGSNAIFTCIALSDTAGSWEYVKRVFTNPGVVLPNTAALNSTTSVTLTASSQPSLVLSNTSTKTVVLPQGSTLALGQIFTIYNTASAGVVLVNTFTGVTLLGGTGSGLRTVVTCTYVGPDDSNSAWSLSFSGLTNAGSAGALKVTSGGTGLVTSGTAGQIVTTNGTNFAYVTALPIANGGTAATSKAAAFDALSPMTTGGDLVYGGSSGTGTRLANGTAGQRLQSNGTTLAPTWVNATTGTVTSVDMSVPSILSISGNPITSTGTLALSYSGTALPIANGGTAATSKAAAFDSLSPMTTGGDIIYGGSSGTGTRLANGTAGQRLQSNGTTLAPTWVNATTGTVTSVDMSVPAAFSISGNPITSTGTLAVGYSGTAIPVANGGTAKTSVTIAATGSSWAGWDAISALNARAFVQQTTSAATANATTTLTVANNFFRIYTGTVAGQIVKLPTTSIPQGCQITIKNLSTQSIAIQASDASAIVTVSANTGIILTALIATPVASTDWTTI